jgi:hypothetical protein
MEYQVEHEFRRIAERLERLEHKIDALLNGLKILIVEESGENVAKSLTVTINGESMNQVLAVGETAQAAAQEWSGLNGTGAQLPLAGAISWVSSDPTVATIDPASGLITAVAPSKLDANNAPIPVNITATDAANSLSNPPGSASVTDSPLTAQSLTVTITPVAAAAPAVKTAS